jgi:hypothetical protein
MLKFWIFKSNGKSQSKKIEWDVASKAEEECSGVFAVNPAFLKERERIRQGGEIVIESLPEDFQIPAEWVNSDFGQL